jgi:hypothetical protein
MAQKVRAAAKMNLTKADRAAYIGPAKAAGFKVCGYLFESDLTGAVQRNAHLDPAEQVPEGGLRGAAAAL